MTPPAAPASERNYARGALSFLAGMFTKHLAVKLAALLLALLLWFTVRRDLLATLKDQPVEVRVELAPGLMLTEPRPDVVLMDFQGPTSQVNLLKRQEPFVRLKVEPDDLLGQLQQTLVYSPERGNIDHAYGSEVRILAMSPPEIRLAVAVEGRRNVEVLPPVVDLGDPQWTVAQVDLVSPEVELVGPRAVLDATASFRPAPIAGDSIVARLPPEEEEVTVERLLTLPAELRQSQVRVASGQEAFRVKITFRREGEPREWAVPFKILAPPGVHPDLRIFPKGDDLVTTREDGTYTIDLTFRGTPRTLDQLGEAIAAGRVFAYVLAEEFSFWAEGQESVGSAAPDVRVELPDELDGRVRLLPLPTKLQLATEKTE